MKKAIKTIWIIGNLIIDMIWVLLLLHRVYGFSWITFIILSIWHITLHIISGVHYEVFRKSRFKEVGYWVVVWLIGVVGSFSFLRYNKWIDPFLFIELAFIYLIAGLLWKIGFLTLIRQLEKQGFIRHNTIVIGNGESARSMINALNNWGLWKSYKPIGWVSANGKASNSHNGLPWLGTLEDLPDLIKKYDVEEIYISTEPNDYRTVSMVIQAAAPYKVIIRARPDEFDILKGAVRVFHPFQEPLIFLFPIQMPYWQTVIKRLIDIIASVVGLVVLSPLMAFIALMVKLSSPGPIIYKQIRLGKYGKPFYLYKFRSMYVDAEKNGPQLAKEEDPRVTPWGRVMRKWRIDELPQLWNVLKGDMSLVGPRPERPYFVDKILKKAPHYILLFSVKPGITSMGVLRFGYASTLEELVKRLRYDLIYLENMSLWLDLKLLLYTLYVVFKGKGK